MEATKENTTLSIDKQIKKDFKLECLRNDNEMSTVIETFMESYVRMSREMHNEIKANVNGG